MIIMYVQFVPYPPNNIIPYDRTLVVFISVSWFKKRKSRLTNTFSFPSSTPCTGLGISRLVIPVMECINTPRRLILMQFVLLVVKSCKRFFFGLLLLTIVLPYTNDNAPRSILDKWFKMEYLQRENELDYPLHYEFGHFDVLILPVQTPGVYCEVY